MHGGAEESRYKGADRRQSREPVRNRVRPSELVAFLGILAVLGVAIPVALHDVFTGDATLRAIGVLRGLNATLFVAAGVLRLVRWRLTGEARSGLLGAALLCLGILSAPASLLAPAMFKTDPALTLAPISRVIAVVACISLVTRALRAPAVDSRLRPLRTAAALVVAGWVLTVAAIAVAQTRSLDGSPHVWAGIQLALTAAWGACAVAAMRRWHDPSSFWLGLSLSTMAASELVRALAFLSISSAAIYATALQLVVAALTIANSGADLSEVLSSESTRLLRLSDQLQNTEELLDEEAREREERLHDARSVIAALKAASLTLDRYDERLDATTKSRLRSSLVSELSRLESVIDARAQEPPTVFRLDVALAPLFIAERRNGLVITSKLGMLSARGRPLEFVTVVQNLLVNARRYAPGSVVTVGARSAGDTVIVYVEDRGPGVPAEEHELIFARGHRGSVDSAEGTGLGLYLARRLMREQSGDIHLESRVGGGARFVLTLPRANAASRATVVLPSQTSGSDETSRNAVRQLRPKEVR